MHKQKQLIGWLKDAHMMETQIVEALGSQLKAADDYPEIKTALQDHIEQTKTHAQRLERRLQDLDNDASGAKDVLGELMGKMVGPMTDMHSDAVIKNGILDYAVEHFEIACYISLKAAAEDLGDQATAALADEIAKEEKQMAELLETTLPTLTQEFLSKEHQSE